MLCYSGEHYRTIMALLFKVGWVGGGGGGGGGGGWAHIK